MEINERAICRNKSRISSYPGDWSPEPGGGRSHGHLQVEGKWQQQWVLEPRDGEGREDYTLSAPARTFWDGEGQSRDLGLGWGCRWRVTRAPLTWGNIRTPPADDSRLPWPFGTRVMTNSCVSPSDPSRELGLGQQLGSLGLPPRAGSMALPIHHGLSTGEGAPGRRWPC